MMLSRGDVVIAAFPGDVGKPRPAVILQSDLFLPIFSTALACPMTSHLIEAPVLRPLIEPSPENGLGQPSQIMTDKLSPLRKSVIRQKVGQLSAVDLAKVETALLHIMGFDRLIGARSEA
ncbi:hypothetical protein BJF92_02945 [Rhizobium rhizosphaerae]|uniref:Type II toxin-antitoxin system PemK/MazF family toxin n=2 Tax=Xaviernesmea rhizosphaerae TaxID=1672749 RepID=A0A1Q9ACD1_9HYPH|nr:hypothetical protein BJF92_02945 [Xaviernesmea rhizosphaerae]